jgi:hypothetical protein
MPVPLRNGTVICQATGPAAMRVRRQPQKRPLVLITHAARVQAAAIASCRLMRNRYELFRAARLAHRMSKPVPAA